VINKPTPYQLTLIRIAIGTVDWISHDLEGNRTLEGFGNGQKLQRQRGWRGELWRQGARTSRDKSNCSSRDEEPTATTREDNKDEDIGEVIVQEPKNLYAYVAAV